MLRKILHEEQSIFFAPSYFYMGKSYLIVTYGSRKNIVYSQKYWNIDNQECWYEYGMNKFVLYESNDAKTWQPSNFELFDTTLFSDVMKASVVVRDNKLYVWFSGLLVEKWDIYFTKWENFKWSKPVCINCNRTDTSQQHIYLPSIIYDTDICYYKMWFVGRDGHNRRIHYAESQDGVYWENFGCVIDLGSLGKPDCYATDCPDVIRYGTRYLMAYGGGVARGIMLAESHDGISWKKLDLVITRGQEQDYNYLYSFYPCFIQSKNQIAWDLNTVDFYFAGENKTGEWSVLCYEKFNTVASALMNCENKYQHDKWYESYQIIQGLPEKYLLLQEDCNKTSNYFENDRIQQLRPSSVPVFRDKKYNIVLKLPPTRVRAETEYMGPLLLGDHINVILSTIIYDMERLILVSPYIENQGSLATIISKNPECFKDIYCTLLNDLHKLFISTAIPFDKDLIRFTGQTNDLVYEWLSKLEAQDVNLFQYRLCCEKTEFVLMDELASAKEHLKRVPHQIVFSSGDLHFNNILCTGNNYLLIDTEYVGYFDIDYLIAKLLGSSIKHAELFEQIQWFVNKKSKQINFQFKYRDSFIEKILTTRWYAEWLKDFNIDYQRVRSFMLAKLYFRLFANNSLDELIKALGLYVCMASLCELLEGEK